MFMVIGEEHRNAYFADRIIKACEICQLSRAAISLTTHYFGMKRADKKRTKTTAKTLKSKRAAEAGFRALFM